MFCSNCGTKNSDDAAFCVACGSPLKQDNPAVADFESLEVSPHVENFTYTKNLTEE